MRHPKTTAALFVVFLLLLSFSQADASGGLLQPGIRGGYYTDNSDFFLGADLKTSLLFFSFNPNVEYVFIDNGTLGTLNLDGTMDLSFIPFVSAWAGAGLGWVYADPDNADSDTESAVNLLLGASLRMPLSPYLQLKYIAADKNDNFVVGVGIRF